MDETIRAEKNQPPEMIYQIVHRTTLYEWYHNFCWNERTIDRLYDDIENITDVSSEYTMYMYQQNKRLHMDMSKTHEALLKLNNYYINLVNKQTLPEHAHEYTPEEKRETIEIQRKLSYQLIAFSQLQFNSTETINNSVATLQEWKEIKDRLKPHHNEFTSTEESIEANIKTIDYFFDNYVNTD